MRGAVTRRERGTLPGRTRVTTNTDHLPSDPGKKAEKGKSTDGEVSAPSVTADTSTSSAASAGLAVDADSDALHLWPPGGSGTWSLGLNILSVPVIFHCGYGDDNALPRFSKQICKVKYFFEWVSIKIDGKI